ncbi:sporulation protein YqfD [Bacillaceae bacterium]
MQNKWLEWFYGYAVLVIEGKRMERLLNLAVHKGIKVWDIARYGEEQGRFAIQLNDVRRLRPLLKETGCRFHVKKRVGLPFLLLRLQKRAGFAAGIALFVIGLYVLSGMIWQVQIVGGDAGTKQEVRRIIEQFGMERGAFKFRLAPPETIRQEIMRQLPHIAWAGIDIQGTKAIVKVVEKVLPDPPAAQNPRHLVAKKTAVIHDIFVEKGKAMVRPHQLVKKGDILISGIVGNGEKGEIVVAKGSVQGETWYESNVQVPLKRERKIFTGARERRFYLLLGDRSIRIWGPETVPYSQFAKQEQRYALRWRDGRLPVGWMEEQLLEVSRQEFALTVEQARALGIDYAKQELLKKLEEEAFVKEEKVLQQYEKRGKVYMKIHFVVIEEIAQEQPIIDPLRQNQLRGE